MTETIVFDGHNDTLLALWREDDLNGTSFISGRGKGHIDLPRCKEGGFVGGFFAMFVPAETVAPDSFWHRHPALLAEINKKGEIKTSDNLLNTKPISQSYAYEATQEMITIAYQLVQTHADKVKICTDSNQITSCIAQGAVAILLHIEGAEAIGPDLHELDALYDLGLRSIGPVWSRPNIFAEGVDFSFPGTPDQGGGLTDIGKKLVRFCNQKHILIDLSHLNEAGFWDVAKISDKPLVATHSNVHSLCASPRNLTKSQLAAIAESNGVVGLNYGLGFLHPDGKRDSNLPLDTMCRHLDGLLEILGEDGVAFGSDFDGIQISSHISDCAGLPNLITAMRHNGYDQPLINKICSENWIQMIKNTLG
ncbi:dipeptidase [Alphaproteobacteria bacterium]|jgi:membrane dipeptidase|nr:membrane dipeptidase [Alphaproteobacteria bacterium]MDA9816277.1 dipeptidase [Alphaproteobacteria bacterium]MDC0394381.1 dipeptidase [Alphaproteobacteria bacterium]MDC0461890.1 dipeptidase [Alphaproteobacteria bacterium]